MRLLVTLAVAATALTSVVTTSACSDFLLNATSSSNVISARTMDFEADLKTVVEVIPRGTSFQELPVLGCVECSDYQWTSKYGFVAFNMFGINVAADGLNEKGLSAAWLYLVETQYPTPQDDPVNVKDPVKPIITSVCSYLLGNYATVDEVREGLKTFQIAEFDERIQVPLLHSTSLGRVPLHVSVHDAHGKSLVVEFIRGETKVYDNVNQVLTNDPPLDQQLVALEANGYSSIPGGYGATERFLRISVLNHHVRTGYSNDEGGVMSYTQATEEQRGISDALHILNTVVRPPYNEATEWSVVRDHKRLKLYIQSTQNMALRLIDLQQLDFSDAASRHLIPVTFGDWSVDVTNALKEPTNHAKTMDLPPRTQIEQLLQKLLNGGGIPPQAQSQTLAKTVVTNAKMDVSSSGFFMGLLSGAALALVAMAVVQSATHMRRRAYYQQIPDPEQV